MRTLLVLIQLLVADRHRLMVENLALRHQLAMLKRSVYRPRIQDSDRMLWILLRRAFKEWQDALIFVKPDTVVQWHRKGFRYYWRRKSRSNPGRPPISFELIHHMGVTAACDFFVVPTARRHLLRALREYVDYYTSRPHQSLDRNSPIPRKVEAVGEVCAKPVLGGRHHRYFRAA